MKLVVFSLAELLRDYFNLGQLESEAITAIIIFALAIIIGWAIYLIFKRYFSRWAKKTKTKIDDEILRNIRDPVLLLAFLLGLSYALNALTFLSPYADLIAITSAIAQILLVTFIITRILNVVTSWLAQREKRVSKHILFALRQIVKGAVFVFAFLAILVVANVDLSGVIVGFGVGGIAIALALQNVLTDVFSAFSIYFDRPFEVGDFVVVGDYSGTVKKIGIKSTRLQLLQGEELVMSNRELTTTSLRNFRRLKKRRVVFKLSVAADTSLEKLKSIPNLLEKIIQNVELVEFERAHLIGFGDFSLNFEVVYYVKTSDYNKYMDTRQKISFGIIEAFEKEGIVMPFPTHTIFLQKETHP
jgi:small-conductance mechanosensitive channel